MKKLLIVQIDGLSYSALDEALRQKLMPFTQKLIDAGWKKQHLFSGLPSTTPAGQMGILYGVGGVVSGFRMMNKKTRELLSPTDFGSVGQLQKKALLQNPKALIQETATICSVYTGTDKSRFTLSEMKPGLIHNKSVFNQLFQYVKSPIRSGMLLLKAAVLSTIESKERKTAINQALFHGDKLPYTFTRLLNELSFADLAYFFTKNAMKDSQSVYVDFVGYDDVAHYYGPFSKTALYSLGIIDGFIEGLYKENDKKNLGFELVILSDHGQNEVKSFSEISPGSLGSAIRTLYPNIEVVERNNKISEKLTRTTDLTCFNSGGLSLVYDCASLEQLHKIDFEKKYPKFSQNIAQLAGIFAVLQRVDKKVLLTNKKGSAILNDNFDLITFANPVEKKRFFYQAKKLLTGPFAADVYILSEPEVTFEVFAGSHGGWGGLQTQSFFMSKSISFDEDTIMDIADIHQYLYTFVHSS